MRSRLFTWIGFSLATVAIITYLHIQKVPTLDQALDGFLSGLYFSGMFATGLFGGVWIFNLRATPRRSPLVVIMSGFNAGLIAWLLVYFIWLSPWMDALGHVAFIVNSNFIFCIGVVMNKFPVYRIVQNESAE